MLTSTFVPIKGQFDQEYFELYRRAGGLFTVFGVENFSDKMLESYQKPFSVDDFLKAAESAHKSKVRILVMGMFGGPGENDQTIEASLRVLAKVPFSFFEYGVGIRILPNTDLFEKARAEGKGANAEELLFPKFYISDEIDPVKTDKRLKSFQRRYRYRVARMIPVGMRVGLANSLGRLIRGRS